MDYVLWGSHGPTTGGVFVKIMGGTAAECRREMKRRRAAGWTDLCTKLSAALPAIAPNRTQAEHDRAAERIARDIGGAE